LSNVTPQRDDLVQKSDHKPRFWFVDYLGLLIAVPLLILPPLTYLELGANQWKEGFIPIIMINAEMKFCVIVIFGSLLTALMGLKVYFLGKTHYLPKLLVLSGGAFLLAVFLSALFAHNLERAWISSFLWHLLPLGIGLAFINIDWTRNKILFFLSLSVLAGTLSSLVALDQHYHWTDWSQKFPRHTKSIPAGIIFNHNFASEYHTPLIPICLGLVLWVKNLYLRGIFILTMAFIFFPVVALSLARGAWVGLIGGCLSTCFFFVAFVRFHNKTLKVNKRKAYFCLIPFIALAFALPLYLMTSDFWKHSKSNLQTSDKRVNGPQVEIEATQENGAESGYVYGEACGGWMTPKQDLKPHKHFINGKWNQYRILAKGPRIQTWVNGNQVSDLVDKEKFQSHPKGFIGLQVHGIKKGTGPYEVAWKNIKISEVK
tara:strand:+ start:174 stop:1463 length:1290 start_codon:yes stop_codon:yes gene_type:complete